MRGDHAILWQDLKLEWQVVPGNHTMICDPFLITQAIVSDDIFDGIDDSPLPLTWDTSMSELHEDRSQLFQWDGGE